MDADTAQADSAFAAGGAADDSTADADSAYVDPVSIGKDVRTPAARVGTYLALAVGPIVAEELAPLGAGAAASQKEIALWPAVVVMTFGGWLATGLLYAFGRWRSAWIRRRFPRAATHVEKLLRAVGKRPWQSALAVRYAFGARVLLPVACGAAHVRPDVYFLASFVSSATWSALFALVGFWFGQTAIAFLHRMQRYDEYVVAVAVGLAVVAWLVLRRRRGRPTPGLVVPPAEPPHTS